MTNRTNSQAGCVSRRDFLAASVSAPALAASAPPAAPGAAERSTLLGVDHRKLVSRADLHYDQPVARSEEGLPVGNGRMGSLVWTTPSALKFQINRVDVFANNSATNSFPERNSDYCGGCGFVDIDFVDFGENAFPSEATSQHLSLYDGAMAVKGAGVAARVFAWPERDVIVVEVNDQRQRPATVNVNLRTLRYLGQPVPARSGAPADANATVVRTRNHTALSRLRIQEDRILLAQEFREGEYYCGSAAAVGVVGRKAKAQVAHQTEVRLALEPGQGAFTVLIASAASFDPQEDVAAAALNHLEAAAAKGRDELAQASREWWHEFWSRAFVHLHSAEGTADYIEQHYTYFLYVMASSSRGKFPPKFNGMLWSTGGDLRTWGAQYWWANQSCYYEALPATNRLELMDPTFHQYTGMYEACALAARQQWGSQGIWIPETVWFDGLARLPEDIAAEMRDLYLLRKPWDQRSARFTEYAETKHPHSSRWNWKQGERWVDGRFTYADKGAGPFGHVTHIFATGAKIAYLYWQRYEYTLDQEWLRNRAYPMLRGVAEFYRNFPNLKKGSDGKYHIHHVNSNEPLWGGRDTDEEISAMRAILPVVIRASEILNLDAAMRPIWREFLDNLAPLPTSDHPDLLRPADASRPRTWVKGLPPAAHGTPQGLPDPNTLPMFYFDLCNLEAEDPEVLKTANATFQAYFRSGIDSKTGVGILSKLAIAASILGRSNDVKSLIANQIRTSGVLANRLTLREGPQTMDAERLGRAAQALELALLQSAPAGPGQDPVLRVFPAWPKEWDAAYTLRARGAFLVSSSMRQGRLEFVEVTAENGGQCRLRNPWDEGEVTLYRDGRKSEEIRGSLLKFETAKGETVVAVLKGSSPDQFKRVVPGALGQ
jgi:hypothetical protein